jgi:uncharacterized protein (DUF1015 family)
MARIYPFNALRPASGLADKVCELPYDVMSSEEARVLAQDRPHSFLHVSKPEIDLESGIDVYSPPVYAKGAENFASLQEQGVLLKDPYPCYYLYQQIMSGHKQVGVVAAASCEEYDSGIIKKHEYTRPAKEDDRVRHIESLSSQTGPVFLTYRAVAEIDAFVTAACFKDPDVDFEAADGVRHACWVLDSKEDIAFLKEQFRKVECLYIADGHHRSAAASRVNASRQGAGQSSRFLSVIFPHDQMQILPYNRAIRTLNGIDPQIFLEQLGNIFEIRESNEGTCGGKNEICLYMNGKWKALTFKKDKTTATTPAEELDVALLQNHVLAPMLGIDDPRTSSQIEFVGGIRGAKELKKMVDEGGCVCAFSLYPTSIEDLMEIADSDGIMPPKSTWFEPKLRDAMFCHMI